ncbi:MAG: endonuclease [DPANN group archaeon]|nr:endonuclease [DPANN group archaeon]
MDLMQIYRQLYERYGPQYWWPGDSREEIIIGAILTQSTSWKNVEKAIVNLKKNNLINFNKILKTKDEKLAQIIKPAGYNNQKAKKLKAAAKFFLELNKKPTTKDQIPTRERLLNIWGIGPETADSILLYAYDQPEFVVDTYTKRIFAQLKLIKPDAKYSEIKIFFESNLPKDVKLFNEYHALIVRAGKELKTNKIFMAIFKSCKKFQRTCIAP